MKNLKYLLALVLSIPIISQVTLANKTVESYSNLN